MQAKMVNELYYKLAIFYFKYKIVSFLKLFKQNEELYVKEKSYLSELNLLNHIWLKIV